MRKSYTREQRHVCGEFYQEIDIFNVTAAEHNASVKKKRETATRLAQENLNDRNAIRHLIQLVNTNFVGTSAILIHLMYRDETLPDTPEAADHDFDLWIRRVSRALKKKGAAPAKYIAVMEYREENGELVVRYHHHVVILCDLSRDELEEMWRTPGKKGEPLGLTNADRAQPDRGSLVQFAEYVTKYKKRKHRWKYSRGLKQPNRPRPNDGKYTRRGLEKLVRENLHNKEFWEKKYPGYFFREASAKWNEYNGWHVTVQLWKPVPKRKC